MQDKEMNASLDTGAEKSCMSMEMFSRLKLSVNKGKTPKFRNALGKDMKTHGTTTVKFKMGNTIFTQDFVTCDELVRPIITGRDFTVSNFIGIIWTKQGAKKVTQDDRVVIEVMEPARGKTLLTTRRIAIPFRHYVKIELECDELQGKLEIKPESFLQQKEPNLWMDNFVVYNIPEDKGEVNLNEEKKPHDHSTNDDKDSRETSEESTSEIQDETTKGEARKVHILYCIFNFSYENHSYIPKG